MIRRAIAWVLLLGFILLLLNLIVFRFYWQLSMGVYLIVVFTFIFTKKKVYLQQNEKLNRDDSDRQQDSGNYKDSK